MRNGSEPNDYNCFSLTRKGQWSIPKEEGKKIAPMECKKNECDSFDQRYSAALFPISSLSPAFPQMHLLFQ
jgi:hypothetical protein